MIRPAREAAKLPEDLASDAGYFEQCRGVPRGDEIVPGWVLVDRIDVEVIPVVACRATGANMSVSGSEREERVCGDMSEVCACGIEEELRRLTLWIDVVKAIPLKQNFTRLNV